LKRGKKGTLRPRGRGLLANKNPGIGREPGKKLLLGGGALEKKGGISGGVSLPGGRRARKRGGKAIEKSRRIPWEEGRGI